MSNITSGLHPKDILTLLCHTVISACLSHNSCSAVPTSRLPHMQICWYILSLCSTETLFSHHFQFSKRWVIWDIGTFSSLRRWVEAVSCLNMLHWSGLKYRQPIHSLKSNWQFCVNSDQFCCSLVGRGEFWFQQLNWVKTAICCAISRTWRWVRILIVVWGWWS